MSSLRWKIVGGALLLVFIPIYILNRYALNYFDRFTRTEHEATLRHYAFIIGEHYRQFRDRAEEERESEAQRLAGSLRRYAEEIGARFMILDAEGRVRFDSAPAPDVGADLSGRAEISEALRGAYSARARLTADRKFMYFYIARPIKTDDRRTVLGVAYVIHHTSPILRALQRLLANQRIATQIALAVATVAAGGLAWTLTYRLRTLTAAARRYAAGGDSLPAKIRGRDEIAELARAFRGMAAEMARRNRFNRDAISETVHELKAPLAAIRGAAELLQGPASGDPEARRRFLANILHQIERMTRLTRQLRTWTAIHPQSVQRHKQRVEYSSWVRDAVERLRLAHPGPCAELTLDLPDDPIPAAIVPELIEQVLSNLLENAVRYTPPDGRITVRVRREGEWAVTTVEDTGCGIAPEDLGRMFDAYFTTVPKDRPREYGSGMGLTIARAIVEAHRGRIWAESPGRQPDASPAVGQSSGADARPFGSRFCFALPLVARHT